MLKGYSYNGEKIESHYFSLFCFQFLERKWDHNKDTFFCLNLKQVYVNVHRNM